jgi:glucose/arabinose dehydrogenase
MVPRVLALVAIASMFLTASPAHAASNPPALALKRITTLGGATAMATRDGDPALYVTTQNGKVVALRAGSATTVLDLSSRVRSAGEQGLLGIVFSPDGSKLYVDYTGVTAGETVLDEYAMVDGRPDPNSRRLVLTFPDPQVNHNGGQLAFGPDGYLYFGVGDGGNQGDRGPGHAPGGNGQSLGTLLGKILRIAPRPSGGNAYTIPADNPFVDQAGARPEIYLYGLRNPWRFSFDRANGDLWIADVGQNEYEEVDHLPAREIAGSNLGWNLYEGSHTYREGDDVDVVMPILELSHDDGNCSIIGGYVYRGTKIPRLRGWYPFTDYCNGAIRAAKIDARGRVQQRDLGLAAPAVSSFGEDQAGNLYVLSQQDGVFRVVAGSSS